MRARAIAALVFLALLPAPARAQTWAPDRPVRIITPTTPGGPLDVIARLIGLGFQAKWGQNAYPDPRPGAAQNIAAEMFFRAPPDGLTLMLAAPTPYAINQHLFRKLNYDPAEFVPVTITVAAPNFLVVPAKLPARTLNEFIALAKSKPGALNYASVGIGSTQHLTGEAFKLRAGVDIVHVPYKGSSEVMVDLLGGRIDATFMNVVDAMPHVRSGTLRVLAAAGPKRSDAFPDIPALAETFPGFSSQSWFGLAAPPKTPANIVDALNGAVREALRTEQAKQIIADGLATAILNSPAEAATWIRADSERWREVIVANKITLE